MADHSLIERVSGSRVNYWAAIVVDALAAIGFGAAGALWYFGPWTVAALVIVSGIIGWSLLEYSLHRWVLHGSFVAPRREHARHHGHPTATISTPALTMTLGAVALWGALALLLPRGTAALFVFGLYAGYNYFALVHHLQHHSPALLARLGFERQLRLHELHHRRPGVHYGISSSLWDRLFGTFLQHDEIVVKQVHRQTQGHEL
jgi:cyclopropane-fatty-acyl-phospholipid synthase